LAGAVFDHVRAWGKRSDKSRRNSIISLLSSGFTKIGPLCIITVSFGGGKRFIKSAYYATEAWTNTVQVNGD
jgi:hypothetical protein